MATTPLYTRETTADPVIMMKWSVALHAQKLLGVLYPNTLTHTIASRFKLPRVHWKEVLDFLAHLQHCKNASKATRKLAKEIYESLLENDEDKKRKYACSCTSCAHPRWDYLSALQSTKEELYQTFSVKDLSSRRPPVERIREVGEKRKRGIETDERIPKKRARTDLHPVLDSRNPLNQEDTVGKDTTSKTHKEVMLNPEDLFDPRVAFSGGILIFKHSPPLPSTPFPSLYPLPASVFYIAH
jgi:hypothetical protein